MINANWTADESQPSFFYCGVIGFTLLGVGGKASGVPIIESPLKIPKFEDFLLDLRLLLRQITLIAEEVFKELLICRK